MNRHSFIYTCLIAPVLAFLGLETEKTIKLDDLSALKKQKVYFPSTFWDTPRIAVLTIKSAFEHQNKVSIIFDFPCDIHPGDLLRIGRTADIFIVDRATNIDSVIATRVRGSNPIARNDHAIVIGNAQ